MRPILPVKLPVAPQASSRAPAVVHINSFSTSGKCERRLHDRRLHERRPNERRPLERRLCERRLEEQQPTPVEVSPIHVADGNGLRKYYEAQEKRALLQLERLEDQKHRRELAASRRNSSWLRRQKRVAVGRDFKLTPWMAP